jgi:dihydrodipicolinate synthase/N-acetylneuraminate lyase
VSESISGGEANPPTLRGVLPVFQTPFKMVDDGIAWDELEHEIDWLFAHGAHGIVMGMVSEILRLSSEERDALARAVCRFAGDRGPVVIGVTAESTAQAVRYAQVATDAGAAALMCALPLAAAPLPDEVVRHIGALVQVSPLPIIVQDASGYVGHALSLDTVRRLEREFSGRVGFKPEAPPLGQRVSDILAVTEGRALIYEGSGGIALVEAFRRGIAGTMPGADVSWAIAALWTALCQGDDRRVQRLRGPLTALIALQGQLDSFVAIEKHLLVKQGVLRTAHMRGPRAYIPDQVTLADAEQLLEELRAVLTDR